MNGRRRCQVRPRRAEEGAAVERPWSPWNVERMRHRCSVCFPRVKQKCQKRGLIQPRDPNSFLVGLRTSKRSYLKFVSLLFRCLFWGFLSLGDLLEGWPEVRVGRFKGDPFFHRGHIPIKVSFSPDFGRGSWF